MRTTTDGKERGVALFMDVRTLVGGVSADDVAAAHEKDRATQGRHEVGEHR